MSVSIGKPAWMTDPATVAVMSALEAAGGADCARFVGGCVRNALMKKPVDDIDIATTLTPDHVTEALLAAGLKAVPTGVEHGTVTAIAKGKPYEVTTLRRDVETDGRRAVVAFTADWAEDAQRRDFRLNALYADAHGQVFDPTAKGVADAKAGKIVFVGDAMVRIREDYLRILRFFRFYAWYGKGEADPNGLAACRALKGLLQGRAAERTQKEVLKLLAAQNPCPSLRLMAETGVLAAVLPQAVNFERLEALVQIEARVLHETEPLLRLAALLPPDPKVAALVAEQLRLSNADRDRLVAAVEGEPKITSWMSRKQARRRCYQLGHQAYFDRVKLAWAGAAKSKAASQWRMLLALGEDFVRPVLPVTGADVAEAGVPKGPLVGQVLREVEEWWIDHDFPEDRGAALERLTVVVQGLG
ncbi:MAG: CCA tRNA nucleotidyltransferase [Caulobacteraceae bacterium]